MNSFRAQVAALLSSARIAAVGLAGALALLSGAAFAQDLVLNHQDSPDPGPAGGVFVYTMTIDNLGGATSTGVTLADTLPTNARFQSVTTTQGSCPTTPAVGADGALNCALGSIAGNASATVTLRVILPTAGTYTNNATVSSTTTDPNPGNNSFAQTTTATTASDLALTAAVSNATPAAGASYTYTLTANNAGPDPLEAGAVLRISFTVPTGSSYRSYGGTGWSCTPGAPNAAGTAVVCSNTFASGLAVGNAPALAISAIANATGGITANFSTSATKSGGTGTMPDGDQSNNSASVSVNADSGTDVSVTQTVSPNPVALNSSATFIITPRFEGGEAPGAGGDIVVTNTLAAGLRYVSYTGTGWACTNAGQVVTCTRPGPYTGGNFTNLPTISLVATATAVSNSLSNTAVISLTAGAADSVSGNNSSVRTLASSNEADLRMNKRASQNPLVVGEAFNYILSVTDLGLLPVAPGQTITVSDTLPSTVQLISNPTGPGWVCGNTGFGMGETISCTRTGAGLASGSTTSDITVPVRQTVAGSATNSATVSLTGAGPVDTDSGGFNAGNNTASASTLATTVGTSVDLQLVSKTASATTTVSGQLLTYVITARNNAPTTATNVVITDALNNLLPAGGLVSATPSAGSCTPTSGNGPNPTVNCNVGSLAQNATATVTLVVRPVLASDGNSTNTASVNTNDQGDTDRTNNSGSITTAVTAIVDLRATKTATPSTATPGTVPAGAPLTYTVTVINDGPSTAQTVTMTDTLPANAAFINLVGISGGGGAACSTVPAANAVGGTLVCNWPNIPTATQRTVTYRVRPLNAAAGGTVANTASVTTITPETSSGNNGATTSTAVTAAQLDILVNKSDNPDPVALGSLTTYTVTITNNGPSFGTNVQLTDVFPAPGSTPTAVFSYQGTLTVDTGGTCTEPAPGTANGTISCAFPLLAPNETATVTYKMRADSIIGAGANSGTLSSRASVTVTEAETQLANNVAIENTTTNRAAVATDLQITKTAGAADVLRGGTVVYSLVVKNNGPLDSIGAQVVDVLPAGLTLVSAPSCTSAGNTVSCDVGALANGATRTFTVTATLAANFAAGTPSIANTATVNAPGDLVPGNNSSTVTTTVRTPPPVTGIPTLSEWALGALAGLMLLFTGAMHRRRSANNRP